jgi:hypothetical protein
VIVKTATGGAHFLKALRTTPRWVRATALEVAEAFLGLVHKGFDQTKSPYGKTWAPLVLTRGKPLRGRGRLRRSWHVEPHIGKSAGAISFTLASSHPHADKHQGGTGLFGPHRKRILPVKGRALHIPGHGLFASVKGAPKREMIPERGLPVKWERKYQSVFETAFEEHFRP